MMANRLDYDIIVIGGGHAGAEAAWAAANLRVRVALVTMNPAKIGAMSCNPAIGGLAKGQMVREIDALGGLMGLATDATGIQFRMLNAAKGAAVRGPRAQCDKYAYAREVQRLLGQRAEIDILAGTVESLHVAGDHITGIDYRNASDGQTHQLTARAVVLTTGTFMRGLMHTGERQTPGGRVGEEAAHGISANLQALGFELGRLKTGTPPRLARESINFDAVPVQPGDVDPSPFSDLTDTQRWHTGCKPSVDSPVYDRFPVLPQETCWVTQTNVAIHDLIRANLHRAPMYNGQIATTGPRYCPSIEDKIVRFADRQEHTVYLEPESLETNEIYCNGISTSLPADVQQGIVRRMRGCENAIIIRPGYAVEYDLVWPHQIDATCMTKRVAGLFLAGQINGTSGYEEAAGQGLLAGVNAVRHIRNQTLVRLGRHEAYLGVMMDDLVTKPPREPYRMFTSRAEWRLLLRADNADDRLTPLGRDWGVVDDHRWSVYQARHEARQELGQYLASHHRDGLPMEQLLRRPEFDEQWLAASLNGDPLSALARQPRQIARVVTDIKYSGYVERQHREVKRLTEMETTILPADFDFSDVPGLRIEARQTLAKFNPATLGQAGRLSGINPTDVMVLHVALRRVSNMTGTR